jgi:hypothetical protein
MIQFNSLLQRQRILSFALLFIGISLLFTFELSAQEKKKSARRDSVKTVKIENGEGILTFLGGPGYTPELKLLLAVGGLYTFKTNKQDLLIQRSTLNGSFGVTTTGGIVSKLILTSFWNEDKMRINGSLWFKNIPDHYWGVGYDEGLNTQKSDSTTAYHRLWWQVNPKFLFRVKKNFYIGPVLDFNQTNVTDESAGVLEDPYYQEFGPKNFNAGLGAIIQYDSRDIPVNAYRGILIQAIGSYYGSYLGGNNNYGMMDIDFRNYQQLGRIDGQTLALNLRARFTAGDVPYGEMSQLGSPTDLRGYTWGRYRHESMVYGIAEYRHMFMNKKKGKRSKHGAVAWVAAGTVMEDVTEMDKWLPNFGIGYRLQVQPRMNVRFDYGFGKDISGLYFNFTEAF